MSDGSHVALLSELRGVLLALCLEFATFSSSSSPRIILAMSAGSAVCRLSPPLISEQCDSSSRLFIMSSMSDGSHVVRLSRLQDKLFLNDSQVRKIPKDGQSLVE